MFPKKVEEALNDQINAELYSAYLYLAMATYLEHEELPGMAHWMSIQVQEELYHAKRLYDYVFNRDGRVALRSIEAPPGEWDSPLAAFEAAYAHEQQVSKRIHDLMALARAENDAATESRLDWFVAEQVEEEATIKAIVAQLRRTGDFGPGLLLIDRELAQRVFAPPTEP